MKITTEVTIELDQEKMRAFIAIPALEDADFDKALRAILIRTNMIAVTGRYDDGNYGIIIHKDR